jgi:hypothetical protein
MIGIIIVVMGVYLFFLFSIYIIKGARHTFIT